MKISQAGSEVLLIPEDDFSVKKIFDCGQCFRWNEMPDGSYVGVALGRAARVREDGEKVYITGTTDDFEKIWLDYFDFGKSYALRRQSCAVDDYMKSACDFGKGIRLLNQDRWETLCSFIISQCNNIPRIKKIVETLCALYGDETGLGNEIYHTFPSAERVASLSEKDLEPLRSGYRAPYILNAAREVADGRLDLEAISRMEYPEAKKRLMEMSGIGEKVANCVVLFSLRMPRAFPVDVWIKKALSEHYPEGLDTSVFGEDAGLAQQYMFYYQRSGK